MQYNNYSFTVPDSVRSPYYSFYTMLSNLSLQILLGIVISSESNSLHKKYFGFETFCKLQHEDAMYFTSAPERIITNMDRHHRLWSAQKKINETEAAPHGVWKKQHSNE